VIDNGPRPKRGLPFATPSKLRKVLRRHWKDTQSKESSSKDPLLANIAWNLMKTGSKIKVPATPTSNSSAIKQGAGAIDMASLVKQALGKHRQEE